MTTKTIYLGPADRQPRTITDRVVSGALLPGTFVTDEGAGVYLQVASDANRALYLLGMRDFLGKGHFGPGDPEYVPYRSGDGAMAYVLESGQEYRARITAGSYSRGQALTVSGGKLVAAGGARIVAFVAQTHWYPDNPTFAALDGDLVAILIA